jgi:aspartyl-tRNA(Asn)/glutamyl-tRNA(Gln) amidotransferase subunit A
MPEVTDTTIGELGRKLRAKELRAVDVVEECLQRIHERNPGQNAFIMVMAEESRSQALEADRELAAGRDRGPLHGVPLSIKDLFDVRGTPTTAASRVREGHVATQDAPAIAHLREAGAIFVGKTNLHEFALGTTSEDSAFGAVHHPTDPARSPGGSSGGSAVSVAAGMAYASIGSDTGGSIRIPAAACGIVGLKPSYGEVSTDGVVPLSPTLDHAGPLTRSVADAFFVYRALLGDAAPRPLAPSPLKGLRLAVPRAYFCDVLDDAVRARFEEALGRLRAAGVHVEDAAIEHADDITRIYVPICLTEAAAYHARTLDEMADRYTAPVRRRLEMGRQIPAEDYDRALQGRDLLRREVDAALAGFDAIALPTLPIPAPLLGASSVQIGAATESVRTVMLRLTQLFNLTGHPAISIPCGQTAGGLPCGFQLAGPRTETVALLRTALACEPYLSVP